MKSWRIRPLAAVLLLTALAVSIIVLFTALLLWDLRKKELEHARGETVSLSRILAEQTTWALRDVDLVMQNMQVMLSSLDAEGVSMSEYPIHLLLRDRLSGMPPIKAVFVTDTRGSVVNTSRIFPVTGMSVPDREYYLAHRADKRLGLYVGKPTRSRVDDTWTLYMSRRLSGSKGEFRGVIAVALNLEYFEALYQSISFDGISPISLYREDGMLVVSQPHDESQIGRQPDGWPFSSLTAGTAGTRQGEGERTAIGAQDIVTYRKVSQFPLMISVANTMDNALAGWRATAKFVLGGALCVIMFVLLAAWALARELRREDLLTKELWESGERLQATINSAMDAILVVDERQRIVLFNPAAESIFGCSAIDAIGASLDRFLPERFRAGHPEKLVQFGRTDINSRVMAPHMEVIGLRANGEEFPLESTISKITLKGETLYTAILRDITERRQAEAQLRESNRQLRELSGSLQQVREEERTRIARELHDELGQQLTGLKLDLSWLARRMREMSPAIQEKVDSMTHQIIATIRSVRRISTDLRPTMLDDLGLGAAIEWLATDFAERAGFEVGLNLAGEIHAVGDAMVTSLFRIAQECLTNVARHAEATRVNISLVKVGDVLELTVSDNGKGMDDSAMPASGGHGFLGVRERAIMMGGVATISSRPGHGTIIKVSIPLPSQTAAEQAT